MPPPARRLEEDDGIFVSGSEEDGGGGGGGGGRGGGGGAAGRGEGWSEEVVLARFDEAAVPKDRNLVFTAFPVHVSGLVPPQVRWRLVREDLGRLCVCVCMRGGIRRDSGEGNLNWCRHVLCLLFVFLF